MYKHVNIACTFPIVGLVHSGRRVDPIGWSVARRKTDMNQSKERGTSNNTIRSRSEVETDTLERKDGHSSNIYVMVQN